MNSLNESSSKEMEPRHNTLHTVNIKYKLANFSCLTWYVCSPNLYNYKGLMQEKQVSKRCDRVKRNRNNNP